jgi:hypothetical protein
MRSEKFIVAVTDKGVRMSDYNPNSSANGNR